jgi:hypothetical protein
MSDDDALLCGRLEERLWSLEQAVSTSDRFITKTYVFIYVHRLTDA